MKYRLTVSAVLVALAVALSSAGSVGCTDERTVPLAPAPFVGLENPGVFAIGIQPTPLVPHAIFGAVCPFTHPFAVPFDLVVQSSRSALLINQIRIDFVDSFGTSGPQLVIPQTELNNRFMNAAISPRGSRAFPFSFEFGCGTARRGTLSVFVQTSDEAGRMNDRRVSVTIR
jgi:hypothetical protein